MEFKAGDRAKCVNANSSEALEEGRVYTVEKVTGGARHTYLTLVEVHGGWFASRFEKVEEPVEPPFPPDLINEPPHYTGRGGIEPIDFIMSNNMSFLEGCIVKYVYRYPWKGGLESLRKAQFYLERLIAQEELRNDAVKQY